VESPRRRIYLTPTIVLEDETGGFHDARLLPGRQGRSAFAFLVLERARPVPRDELADVLWPGTLPVSWEASLSAIGSKIRSVLSEWDSDATLESGLGCFQLRVPERTWVDLEASLEAQHTAEVLAQTDLMEADRFNDVAYHISTRPFLPGDDSPWIDRIRRQQSDIFIRSAILKAKVWIHHGEPSSALMVADDALRVDPFCEELHRQIMRAHAAAGSRAKAAVAYKRLAELLESELGIRPSAETDAVYAEICGHS
jgi:DNA-binding SARP family transcriptional activator